jgi:hypothetical protein
MEAEKYDNSHATALVRNEILFYVTIRYAAVCEVVNLEYIP